MLTIYKLQADHTIDFAAEELKKYMRMMMPETGDIIIAYAPEAKDGFRLGLLEDFNLPFTGKRTDLDDEYYINMMSAWFFATALAKQWESTLPYIIENRLTLWVHNKTIQKAVESYRITPKQNFPDASMQLCIF